MLERHTQVVAVVGTAGSGKTTLGMEIARRFRVNCVDAGIIYRGVSAACKRMNLTTADELLIASIISDKRLVCGFENYQAMVIFDGETIPHAELTSDWVNSNISGIAGLPLVRQQVRTVERSVATHGPVVMVGRDIGTVVFPDACAKFYVDVSLQVRATRRAAQRYGVNFTQEQYYATLLALAKRDFEDMSRVEGRLEHVKADTVAIENFGQLSITADMCEHLCRKSGFCGPTVV